MNTDDPLERNVSKFLQETELERANRRIKDLEERLDIVNRVINSMGQRRIDDPESREKDLEDLKEIIRQLRDLENRNDSLRLDNRLLDRMLKDMTHERDQGLKQMNRTNEPSQEVSAMPSPDRRLELEP